MEIIDFHTHPYINKETNIVRYPELFENTAEEFVKYAKAVGITKVCGSVIFRGNADITGFDAVRYSNDIMLGLMETMGDFYVPGFHIHPEYVRESLEEIERMHKHGVKLIGEIVPSLHGGWQLDSKGLPEILDLAGNYGMIVNFHSANNDEKTDAAQTEKMVAEHKNVTFVAAHPCDGSRYSKHLELMQKYDNYYLDLSGTGLFRNSMLRYGINKCGVERFLFGTDYPVCTPSMYIGGVLDDPLLTDDEKEAVMYKNAKRLLNT